MNPSPTPTPAPVTQAQINSALEALNSGLTALSNYNQANGVWGIVLILVLGAFILAFMYLWSRRGNAQTENHTQRTLVALLEKQDKRIEVLEAEENLKEEQHRKEVTEIRSESTESLSAISDAMNRIADYTDQQNKLFKDLSSKETNQSTTLAEVKGTLDAMNTTGSKPVQDIAEKVNEILANTTAILATVNSIAGQPQISLQEQITDLKLAASAINGAVEKLKKTDTQPIPVMVVGDVTQS